MQAPTTVIFRPKCSATKASVSSIVITGVSTTFTLILLISTLVEVTA
ncbi:MAG: hypothetical protein BWX46_00781 [Candidatus Cloacimonetes bacterium ADurb.Bin003]|nr:MAG: hypothetical protein BWX46_00781 [Candidatus Cloacimonetes bacterium ADurb.Bin003]